MLAEFAVVSFATFIGWQVLKSLAWFYIPARLANFIVPSIAYGLTYLSHPSILIALASAGGCAVIHRFIDLDSVEPWTLKLPARSRKQPNLRRSNSDKNRIPKL